MKSEGATTTQSAADILPGKFDRRFARVFAAYTRWLFRRRFASVRIELEGWPLLTALDDHDGPAMVVLNHPGWWDPLVCVLLASLGCPSRSACAPMERVQLEKFNFFRKLGLFGIDPDNPNTLGPMIEYVEGAFASEARTTLWLTPQGQFVDPRVPIEIRPGAASIAAKAERARPGRLRVLSVAVEYVFGLDQRPDVLLRVRDVQPLRADGSPALRTGVGGWQRGIVQAMRANQEALAELVVARDFAPFHALLGGRSAINPIYDWWLRLRGKSAGIEISRPAIRKGHGKIPAPVGKTAES